MGWVFFSICFCWFIGDWFFSASQVFLNRYILINNYKYKKIIWNKKQLLDILSINLFHGHRQGQKIQDTRQNLLFKNCISQTCTLVFYYQFPLFALLPQYVFAKGSVIIEDLDSLSLRYISSLMITDRLTDY